MCGISVEKCETEWWLAKHFFLFLGTVQYFFCDFENQIVEEDGYPISEKVDLVKPSHRFIFRF